MNFLLTLISLALFASCPSSIAVPANDFAKYLQRYDKVVYVEDFSVEKRKINKYTLLKGDDKNWKVSAQQLAYVPKMAIDALNGIAKVGDVYKKFIYVSNQQKDGCDFDGSIIWVRNDSVNIEGKNYKVSRQALVKWFSEMNKSTKRGGP